MLLSFEEYLKETGKYDKYTENVEAYNQCKTYLDNYYKKQIEHIARTNEEKEKKKKYQYIKDNCDVVIKKLRREYLEYLLSK